MADHDLQNNDLSDADLEEATRSGPPPGDWRKRALLQAGATVLFLGLGLAGAGGLVAAGKAAEKGTPPEKVDLVEVMSLSPETARAVVQTTGTVVAAQQSVLAPEVTGRLVWVSEKLRPGGRFEKGETLARVDATDYQVALDQARVAVEQAELELALEENRGAVASKEWELLGRESGGDGTLARREPHLQVSKANLASAQAGLRRAQQNLNRTSIRAPYNGVVLSESVDRGQVVGAQSQVAVFAGSDTARVEVSVPFDRLASLDVPGVTGVAPADGSLATVTQRLAGGRSLSRDARVVGLGGQLDPQTRTATLLLEVQNPLDPPDGGLPLLVGAFVDVTIDGRERDGALSVPRTAIYDGDTVWVVNSDERLEPRTVTTGWSLSTSVEVRSGLKAGDKVVTTPLSGPIAGTRVKQVSGETAARGN